MAKKETSIPIFFSVDDRFVPYLVVTLTSLIKNASTKYHYHIHVLCTELKKENVEAVQALANKNFEIFFDDCSDYLRAITDRLPIRDYYSKTTYFRLFIGEMFPDYDKVIYLDSDIIVLGDVADLYHHEIGDNILGACPEAVMKMPETKLYSEKVLGIEGNRYFNAGVLIINTEQFREKQILDRFVRLLNVYNFVVAQDQDYLNVICKDHVYYLKNIWNIETCMPVPFKEDEFRILHYIMANKPWNYEDAKYAEYFWKYAKLTLFYDLLKSQCATYSEESKEKDAKVIPFIMETCLKEANSKDNYLNMINATRDPERVRVSNLAEEYEKEGKFDVDLEKDPPSRMLMPNEVDYMQKKLSSKISSAFAFYIAGRYLKKQLKKKKIIIKDIVGIENIINLNNSGAVITCNHFSPMDSFAIQMVYQELNHKKSLLKKRKFFRVIREGNYTNFPGFFGFLMRHCNTLPLSSNFRTMRHFILSTDCLLQEGNYVLFYPEQSLWWNYRKPKPLKKGAFSFAANNRVPVVPVFITMADSMDYTDQGYPVQEYTIHIGKLIYPDPDYSTGENATMMMEKNYEIWKEIYESTYQQPLEYTTDKEKLEENEMFSRIREI